MENTVNMEKNTKTLKLNSPLVGVLIGGLLLAITLVSILLFQSQNKLPITSNSRIENEIINLIQSESINELPETELINEGRLKGLISSLEDPYSSYLPAREEQDFNDSLNQRYQGVGIRFDETDDGFVVDRVFQASPAQEGGVLAGDILLKVNNEEVGEQSLAEVAEKIRGEENTQVELVFKRQESEYTANLTRRRIQTDLVYLTIRENLAVVEITSFGNDLDEKMNAIATTIKNNSQIQYIALDVRSNSGGLLNESVDIMSYFLPENSIVIREKTKDGEKTIYSEFKANNLVEYPLVVWIDQNSASASEIVAGALRDIREVKVIGETSFGKGTVQRIYSLSNGDKVRLTIAEWITPNRTEINEKGVEPDLQATTQEEYYDQTLQHFSTQQV